MQKYWKQNYREKWYVLLKLHCIYIWTSSVKFGISVIFRRLDVIQRNAIKILQSVVEKLEKELDALRDDGQSPSSTCKILLRTNGGDVGIPAAMKQEEKVAYYVSFINKLVK